MVFFQTVAKRRNDTALYTYMKTTLTRQISLSVRIAKLVFLFHSKITDRRNAIKRFLVDINKVLLIKNTLQQFKLN